jgi:hypothetical protein
VATLVLADTDAGWTGSLPEDAVRARVAGAERMLAGPAQTFPRASRIVHRRAAG